MKRSVPVDSAIMSHKSVRHSQANLSLFPFLLGWLRSLSLFLSKGQAVRGSESWQTPMLARRSILQLFAISRSFLHFC